MSNENRNDAQDALNGIKSNFNHIGKYLLSFCCIFKEDDADHVKEMLTTLPLACEVVVVKTVPGGLNQVKNVQRHENRVYAEWHYQDFSYSDARNACKALATSPILFSIDADERLLRHQWNDINTYALELNKSDLGGLTVWVVSVTDHSVQYTCDPINQVRMYKNNPEYRWCGVVHENIRMSIENAGHSIGHSPLLIHHTGYDCNEYGHLEKLKNRIGLQRRDLESLSNDYFFENFCNDVQSYMNLKQLLRRD